MRRALRRALKASRAEAWHLAQCWPLNRGRPHPQSPRSRFLIAKGASSSFVRRCNFDSGVSGPTCVHSPGYGKISADQQNRSDHTAFRGRARGGRSRRCDRLHGAGLMLSKPKTTGAGKVVRFKRRKQKRNPRRPLEAVAQDWERWDAAAETTGLNWSEFTRRALNAAADNALGVAEKGPPKLHASTSTKATPRRAGRKG